MIRYNITEFRSRDGPSIAASAFTDRSGRRHRSLPRSRRGSPVRRSLVGSLGGHAVLLIALLWLTSHYTLPLNLEPEAVALVFEPAPTPVAQMPASPAPAPQPPPPPATPPTPPQPQQPPPQPSPETPPPPQEPQPLPEELPLPPLPAPEPPPLPVRRPSPPRPSATPPRPQPAQTAPAATEAPPAQAAPSAGPTASASQAEIAPSWQSALGAWLQAHKSYPAEARRRDEQGRAIVRFKVEHTGQVLDVELVSGTGSVILDDAVKHMLTGATVPPFPPGMDQDQVTVTVQLRYKLE